MILLIAIVSAMLALIATMLAVTMLIAWRDFGRAPQALSWAGAFAVSAIHWYLSLVVLLVIRPAEPRDAALAPILVASSALLYRGFRQRAGRAGRARSIGLVWAGAMAVIGLLLVSPYAGWTTLVADIASAGFLVAAARLIGQRGQRRTTAERGAIGALLMVSIGQVGIGAVGQIGGFADPQMRHAFGQIVGVMVPTSFTALGLATVFLIAADLSARMQRLAQTDPLTGLLNRRGLDEAVAQGGGWRGAARSGGAAVMADLDSFKHLNDRFGHEAGDAALRAFAALVRAFLRPGEAAARTGGEEFALLLPGHTIAQAAERIEALRAATEDIRLSGRPEVRVSASFGIAAIPPARRPAGPVLTAAIERADAALMAAKGGGRNRIALADDAGGAGREQP